MKKRLFLTVSLPLLLGAVLGSRGPLPQEQPQREDPSPLNRIVSLGTLSGLTVEASTAIARASNAAWWPWQGRRAREMEPTGRPIHKAHDPWDVVIFDGNDDIGDTYYDASCGSARGSSALTLVADKMPIDTVNTYRGNESGVIAWVSAEGGHWELFVADDRWMPHNADRYDTLFLWLNGPEQTDGAALPKVGLEDIDNEKSSAVKLGDFVSGVDGDTLTWERVSIPLSEFGEGGGFEPFKLKTVWFSQGESDGIQHTLWVGEVYLACNSVESFSLDLLQKASFNFFWHEVNHDNGLIRDKTDCSVSSIACLGFGLTAIGIGESPGWINRDEAKARVLLTLRTLWNGRQGDASTGCMGCKGFFYHLLTTDAGVRDGTSELSSIDTALLVAGILFAESYFDDPLDAQEAEIRALAGSLYRRVEWDWMLREDKTIAMQWTPEDGFSDIGWSGYNEAMILYLLAIGSPTHPIPASSWKAWCSTYAWETYDEHRFLRCLPCNPLFVHQYSHCWIDFRGTQDTCCVPEAIDYFEDSRQATLANRGYCAANALDRECYHQNSWGITASDGPSGYRARGPGPDTFCDDGTIAPTAAGGSIVFTPTESFHALEWMYDSLGAKLWGPYGFRDAYNCTQEWFSRIHIGIDQGPIVLMIENHQTQLVWHYFMRTQTITYALASVFGICGVRGDLNSDGAINVLDVLVVANIILGIQEPDACMVWRADCNNDRDINILDALAIVRVIMGIGTCGP